MKQNILLVDDDCNILQGYKRGLRKWFKLDTASSGKEAIERIERDGPYAIVISDMCMPGMNGLELLCVLKEKNPDIVRIMLTGNADQKTAVDAVNRGEVFRFLCKPCTPEAMAEVLKSGLAKHQLIQQECRKLENKADEVQQQTEKPSLQTQNEHLNGLMNRRTTFELRMQNFIRLADEECKAHALCYLDLEHFYDINDTCGHFAGDECLERGEF